MEWDDIQDPKSEYEFINPWVLVRGQYEPEEIQDMINKHGVEGMVRTVNEHFKMLPKFGHPVLRRDRVSQQKIVTQF